MSEKKQLHTCMCSGTVGKWSEDQQDYICEVCGGYFTFDGDDDWEDDRYHICPYCHGTGVEWDGPGCRHCDGMGYEWWL